MRRADMMSTKGVNKLLDDIALKIWGMTKSEALSKGICVCCKKNIGDMHMREIDVSEWEKSGLCFECFDQVLDREGQS